MTVGLPIIVLYLVGFCVTQQVAYRNWRRSFPSFKDDFSGFVWGCLVAFMWPLVAPAYLVFLLTKRWS